MRQFSDKKDDGSKVELVTELDAMRPAEKLENNKRVNDVPHEDVILPNLNVREVIDNQDNK